MKKKNEVKLGNEYQDPITKFKGIAMGKTIWLYGCSRIGLQAGLDKNGKVPDLVWFDELQLLEVESDEGLGGPAYQGKETG